MTSPRKPFFRRSTALALTAFLAAGVSACTPGGNLADLDVSGPSTPGGSVVFATNSDTTCLDPHQSGYDIAAMYARPIIDSLVAQTADGSIHPWLAESWDISPDGLEYTFHLRDGVTFSNGEPFDAAAVKANLDHIVAPETASALAAGRIASYMRTDVVDELTARVVFSTPNSAFLPYLASAYLGMQAPSTLTKPAAELCTHIVGTGPFVSEGGYTIQQGISYTRRDDYDWAPPSAEHQGPAYLEKLEFRIIPEDAVRVGMLQTGEVDGIGMVPPVNLDIIEEDGNLYTDSVQAPGANYLYFPNNESGPFSEVAVRKAFQIGVDFDTIIESTYFGAFEPADSPIAPNTQHYDASQEAKYQYDPEEAARLLDEAGWLMGEDGIRYRDGEPLTVEHIYSPAPREQRDTLIQTIQAAGKQIGFDYRLVALDSATRTERVGSGDYDVYDLSQQQATPDVLRQVFLSDYVPDGGFNLNLARYRSESMDAELLAALDTTDPEAQFAHYSAAQAELADEAAVFPIYVFSYIAGMRRDLQGVTWEPQAFPIFYDAWKVEAE